MQPERAGRALISTAQPIPSFSHAHLQTGVQTPVFCVLLQAIPLPSIPSLFMLSG